MSIGIRRCFAFFMVCSVGYASDKEKGSRELWTDPVLCYNFYQYLERISPLPQAAGVFSIRTISMMKKP